MKINYGYIKVSVLLVLVGFLFTFTNGRNAKRVVSKPNIVFVGATNLFLTHDNVSKLLIQNLDGLTNQDKRIIDLNRLENALNANQMVKNAEVSMSVNGILSAEVEQKTPIARVHTDDSYYIDDDGEFMPLSSNYAARVPLVTGKVNKLELQVIYKLAKVIDEDRFLKQHVIEINQTENNELELRLRQFDFRIQLGNLKMLNKKINNFKAFYKKAIENNTINTYSSINLRFDNQVICTKK